VIGSARALSGSRKSSTLTIVTKDFKEEFKRNGHASTYTDEADARLKTKPSAGASPASEDVDVERSGEEGEVGSRLFLTETGEEGEEEEEEEEGGEEEEEVLSAMEKMMRTTASFGTPQLASLTMASLDDIGGDEEEEHPKPQILNKS